ncbi:hypothetical protein EDD18DRAFT_1155664 [Armillaria luteobubalina]|uniref:Uncharacterized protein n=1 Tax=Armillaria luteobubalina TaxID=153913 RepID=A0AA39QCF8_9AGAR|nr:hypothetical protein EDD18DRAFT_1155664 [Armillaria luteobubalina]
MVGRYLYVGENRIYNGRGYGDNEEFEEPVVKVASPISSTDGIFEFGKSLNVALVPYRISSTQTTTMPASSKSKIAAIFRAVAAVLSIWYSYTLICFVKNVLDNDQMACQGNSDTTLVRMVVEDTVHFRHSDPTAQMEWKYSYPRGLGSFRAGPDHLAYFMTTFHELHCVESLGKMLVSARSQDWGHTQYCLNMLRQLALCHPDMTLERGDFMERNFTEERIGEEHICNDWEKVSDAGTRNWIQWYEWKKHAGSVDSKRNGL